MKRIYAVGDTHRRLVLPPPGYDLTVHLGDFVEYFDVGPAGEREELYRRRFDEVRSAYTHVVGGNHERMFIRRFGSAGIPTLSEALSIPVEGIVIRACHYLYLPRPGSIDYPPVPDDLLENMYREVIRHDARVVLYGHTHHQRYDLYQGFHLVDVGFGEAGAAAEIIVDGTEVRVTLIPGAREREESGG